MADSGGTKIIALVTICIILMSFSFSGCFEEDKENKDDLKLDTDGDMILDKDDMDDDNDGILDEWENKYKLDSKNPNDKYNDLDNDGVDNKNEFDTGTDPTNSYEFNKDIKQNITKYGIPLYLNAPFLYGIINETDFDDDGLPDKWEEYMDFNATDPYDANLDLDRDGWTTKAEYDSGTDPWDVH
jgi:hypothetical protein